MNYFIKFSFHLNFRTLVSQARNHAFIEQVREMEIHNMLRTLHASRSSFSTLQANPTSKGLTTEAISGFETKMFSDSCVNVAECAMCTICIHDFDQMDLVTLLPCQHSFHQLCISTWLDKSTACPNCRLDLSGVPTRAKIKPGALPIDVLINIPT